MPRFGHLIFDLDGTLVDSRADLAAATNHMLAELGRPLLSVSEVEKLIGLGARVLIERALGPERVHLTERGYDLFMDYYNVHLLDHTRPYSGIVALLEVAQGRGIHLSVLTNKPERPAKAILSGLGLASSLAAVVGGDTLPQRKPDPSGVYALQRETGCPLDETLLVGDSDVDVQTGRAAGVATCGVEWGFGRPASAEPTYLAESVGALRQIVLT